MATNKTTPFKTSVNLLPVLGGLLTAGVATANDRHFTYTYESAVLPEGGREFEVWTTGRFGREQFYSRYDQRLEFEVGLTSRLQTSMYLNYKGLVFDSTDPMTMMTKRASSFEYGGISSEWKYKLTDPVADALGSALYGEVSAAPDEIEFEAKLIFDKQVGNVLLAANLVGELEIELRPEAAEKEWIGELDLAASYRFTPNLSVGLELRNHNEIAEGTWEHSALFLGPVLAYASKGWWVALTVMPQLPSLYRSAEHGGGHGRDLHDHEKFNARLLFSFHL